MNLPPDSRFYKGPRRRYHPQSGTGQRPLAAAAQPRILYAVCEGNLSPQL